MRAAGEFWGSFPQDPRDAAVSSLRASDADRERVHELLAEAYADGRLTREEHDERSAAVIRARTLGELPPLVSDLLPDRLPARRASRSLASATPEELRQRAVEAYRRDVREAASGLVGITVVTSVIWAMVMFGGFFWPGFVIAAAAVNLLQLLLRRRDVVEEHVRRLERKQANELRRGEEDG